MLYENNGNLKSLSRGLRRTQTDAERKLWSKLRGRQLNGYKFYRQFAINRYILDFYSSEIKLGIELDGSQHRERKVYDDARTKYLNGLGIRILRYWDNEVLLNIDGVLQDIQSNIR